MKAKEILWEWGTGYDLFASLVVLHDPNRFGLRASWAAGVRSRIPSPAREILEQAQYVIRMPLHWLYQLPGSKDAMSVHWALGQLPAEVVLPTLALKPDTPPAAREIFLRVAKEKTWDENDVEVLRTELRKMLVPPRPKSIPAMLEIWSRAEEFGQQYAEALRQYHFVFYREEEAHVYPALEQAINKAKESAAELSLDELLVYLSKGVRFETEETLNRLIMVPSYWLSPFVIFEHLDDSTGIFVFGGRPENVSLVPGEQVPEEMLRVLKTLSDPTRLRILRYITHEQITPAEIARRLRLRASTVTHHLNALRLAGLVYLIVDEQHERRYQARIEMVEKAFDVLRHFLNKK